MSLQNAQSPIHKTPGLDTIPKIREQQPGTLYIPKDSVRLAEQLRQVWNSAYIAFIPYCITCKEPLVWIWGDEKQVFECLKCDAKWEVRD